MMSILYGMCYKFHVYEFINEGVMDFMSGFLMCPKCGEFLEVQEDMPIIMCHRCETLHIIFPAANKDDYSSQILPYKIRPAYMPSYGFKYLYRASDCKSGAIASYKLHLMNRKVFQAASRIMNRGLYPQALQFFALIPGFEGVSAKEKECREAIYSKVFDAAIKRVEEAGEKFSTLTPANIEHVIAAMILELSDQKLPYSSEFMSEIRAVAAKKHKDFMKTYTPPKRKGNFAIILGVALQGLVMWIIFKILEALLS